MVVEKKRQAPCVGCEAGRAAARSRSWPSRTAPRSDAVRRRPARRPRGAVRRGAAHADRGRATRAPRALADARVARGRRAPQRRGRGKRRAASAEEDASAAEREAAEARRRPSEARRRHEDDAEREADGSQASLRRSARPRAGRRCRRRKPVRGAAAARQGTTPRVLAAVPAPGAAPRCGRPRSRPTPKHGAARGCAAVRAPASGHAAEPHGAKRRRIDAARPPTVLTALSARRRARALDRRRYAPARTKRLKGGASQRSAKKIVRDVVDSRSRSPSRNSPTAWPSARST
ncbi:MAG: hypothetical protein MZV49_04415 [Rhodopseudomonas palustris]|nr:hypothetical protein [Rhodopseudomonas palustris]